MPTPRSGSGPFFRGERLTAAKLNELAHSMPRVRAAGRSHMEGDTVVTDDVETMHMRVTGRSGPNHSWTEVYRLPNGTWANSTRTSNLTYDPAVERNNSVVSAGPTVYYARRSTDTSEWIFANTSGGGGGGSFTANSTETAVMILGTYDTYKDCPDVPPKPPTTITNLCNGTRGTELCVPAYAYAVYQRCGYVWNKIGDTRTYQVWANEMNGGTITAFRRLFIPRWGGDFDPTTGLPDPGADCMGLAVMGYSSQGALTCTCPTCLSSPPEGACLKLKFRTIPRPENPLGCSIFRSDMDSNSAWDKDYEIVIAKGISGYCNTTNASEDGVFTFDLLYSDGSSFGCDWGPDVYDPCDPCEHWGTLYASISVDGGNTPNCGGAGHWTGEFKARDICNLLCSCGNGPVLPAVSKHCQGCNDGATPPVAWNAIVPGSIQIVCC